MTRFTLTFDLEAKIFASYGREANVLAFWSHLASIGQATSGQFLSSAS